MSQKKVVLVIGDVILDIIPSVFPLDKNAILTDGETFIGDVTFQKGGCAGNFSCVLKSILPEGEVRFVSRIGSDKNGDFLIQEMERYGVNQRFIRNPSAKTQITIAISYNDGERHFLTYLGPLNDFSAADIRENDLKGIDHLAYRGPWFSERLLFGIKDILKRIHDEGISVSMDLGFDPYWNKENTPEGMQRSQKRKNAVLDLLPYVDFLFGNEGEYKKLTDTSEIDDALDALFKRGANTLVMHRGSKGASIIMRNGSNGGELYRRMDIPAAKVKVVNPVGSGDTFDSIFIAKVLDGLSPVHAAVYATAGAAYLLQSPPGTPISFDVLEDFIQTQSELKQLLE